MFYVLSQFNAASTDGDDDNDADHDVTIISFYSFYFVPLMQNEEKCPSTNLLAATRLFLRWNAP